MPVFRDGFFAASGSSWPAWSHESWSPYVSNPADGEFLGLREQQGVGRLDVDLVAHSGHQSRTEVTLKHDLSGTDVDFTDDLWRVTWKFRVNKTAEDDILDLFLYVGTNYDVFFEMTLHDRVAGGGAGLESDFTLHGPDDDQAAPSVYGVAWDEGSFFYAELNHVVDATELRLWRADQARPSAPLQVVTNTTPPSDNVVGVDYNWRTSPSLFVGTPVQTDDSFTRATTQGDGHTSGPVGANGPNNSTYGLGPGYVWSPNDSPYKDATVAANSYQHSRVYCDGSRVVIPAGAYDSYIVDGARPAVRGEVAFSFYVPHLADTSSEDPAYGVWYVPPAWDPITAPAGVRTYAMYAFTHGDGTWRLGSYDGNLDAAGPTGTFTPTQDSMYRCRMRFYGDIGGGLVEYTVWKASDGEGTAVTVAAGISTLLTGGAAYVTPTGGVVPCPGSRFFIDFWYSADTADVYFDDLELISQDGATVYPGVGGRGFLELDDVIAASGADVSAGPGAPIYLEINGEDVSGFLEWGMSFEQVLGGVGRATLTVQDRSLTYQPECHWDVRAVLRRTGFVLWRGEIISEPEDLPVGFPWRRWVLDCADYNNELSWRLVGALNGKVWRDIDNLGDYVNVDPFAQSLATDKQTVQVLLDRYIRVHGEAIDTSTYVYKYLEDFATLYWSYSTLQQALEDLAAGVATNLQFWVDPDLRFHWVSIPAWQDLAQENVAILGDVASSPLARGFPQSDVAELMLAPVSSIGDEGEIGSRDLHFTLDGSSMPEQIYVRGATGYVYNAPPIDAGVETTTTAPVVQTSLPPGAAYTCRFVTDTRVYYKDASGLLSGVGSKGYVVVPAGKTFYTSKYQWVPWHTVGTPHPNDPLGRFLLILNGPYAGKYVSSATNYYHYGEIVVAPVPSPSTVPPTPGSPPPPPAIASYCDDGAWASSNVSAGATLSNVSGHTKMIVVAAAQHVRVSTGLNSTIKARVLSGHWRVSMKFLYNRAGAAAANLEVFLFDQSLSAVFKVVLDASTVSTTYQLVSSDPDVGLVTGDAGLVLLDGHTYDVVIEGIREEDLVRFKIFDDSLQEPAWTDAVLYGSPAGTDWGLQMQLTQSGAGSITLTFAKACVEDRPVTFNGANVGIGGSGFVKDALQDPNKRQAFLEAPVSADRSTRDAVGGQVLYRGSRPTLRGSCKVTGGVAADGSDHGAEGWRVGQVVPIFDSRLPDFLTGRNFVVQRVAGTLIPTHDLREYVLDWGDGPTSRWTMHAKTPRGGGVGLPPPAIQMVVDTFDLSPAPNTSQVVTAQLVNGSGQPWSVSGKMVQWTLEVYDADGAAVTGEGSITPAVSMTDANGKARTTLKTGPNLKRVYFVFAEVPVS